MPMYIECFYDINKSDKKYINYVKAIATHGKRVQIKTILSACVGVAALTVAGFVYANRMK